MALARGAPMFDINKVMQEQAFHAVEFMFPHFFLLPMIERDVILPHPSA